MAELKSTQTQKEERNEALNFALLLIEEYVAEEEENITSITMKFKDIGEKFRFKSNSEPESEKMS